MRARETTRVVLSRFILAPQWRGVSAFADSMSKWQARRALLALTRAGILQQRTNDGRAEWNLDREQIEQAARLLATNELQTA